MRGERGRRVSVWRSALALACVVVGAWGCSNTDDAPGTQVEVPDYAQPPTPRPEVPVSDPPEAVASDTVGIAGRVLDYDTRAGIAGARLETFLPTSERLSREDGTYTLVEGVEPFAEFYRLWVTHPDYATSSTTLDTEDILATGVDVEMVSLENAIRGRLEPASAHFPIDRHGTSLSLLNTGLGTLSVSVAQGPDWVELDPPQLAIQPDARGTFQVRLRPEQVRAALAAQRSAPGAAIQPTPSLRGVVELVDAQTQRKLLMHVFAVLGDVWGAPEQAPRLVAEGDAAGPLTVNADAPVALAWTARANAGRPLQQAQVHIQVCAGDVPADAPRCEGDALELERRVTSDAQGRVAVDLAVTRPGTFTVLASIAAYAEAMDGAEPERPRAFTRQQLIVEEDTRPTFTPTARFETNTGEQRPSGRFGIDELPMVVTVEVAAEDDPSADLEGQCVALRLYDVDTGLALDDIDTVAPDALCGDDPLARRTDDAGEVQFRLGAASAGSAALGVTVNNGVEVAFDVEIVDGVVFPGELTLTSVGDASGAEGLVELNITLDEFGELSDVDGTELVLSTPTPGVVVRGSLANTKSETISFEGRTASAWLVVQNPPNDVDELDIVVEASFALRQLDPEWGDEVLADRLEFTVPLPRLPTNLRFEATPRAVIPGTEAPVDICAQSPNPLFEYPLTVSVGNTPVASPATFAVGIDNPIEVDGATLYEGCLGVVVPFPAGVEDEWFLSVELGNANASLRILTVEAALGVAADAYANDGCFYEDAGCVSVPVPLVFTARDSATNPLPDVPVTLALSPQDTARGCTLVQDAFLTDAQGNIPLTVQCIDERIGNDPIEVQWAESGETFSVELEFRRVPDRAMSAFITPSGDLAVGPDNAVEVTVEVRDATGNPLSGMPVELGWPRDRTDHPGGDPVVDRGGLNGLRGIFFTGVDGNVTAQIHALAPGEQRIYATVLSNWSDYQASGGLRFPEGASATLPLNFIDRVVAEVDVNRSSLEFDDIPAYATKRYPTRVYLGDAQGAPIDGLAPEVTITPVSVPSDPLLEAVIAPLVPWTLSGYYTFDWVPPLPGAYDISVSVDGAIIGPELVFVSTPFWLRAVDVPELLPSGTPTDVTLEVWDVALDQPHTNAEVSVTIDPSDATVSWLGAPAPQSLDAAGQFVITIDAQRPGVWDLVADVDGVPTLAFNVVSALAPRVTLLGLNDVAGDGAGGCTQLDYEVLDVFNDVVDLTVRYRVDGGAWQRATQGYYAEASLSSGLDGLRPNGNLLSSFVWDAPRDLGRPPEGKAVNLEIEMTARSRTTGLSGIGTLETTRFTGVGLRPHGFDGPLAPINDDSVLDDVAFADFDSLGDVELVALRAYNGASPQLEINVWRYDGDQYGSFPAINYPIFEFENFGAAALGDFDTNPVTSEVAVMGRDTLFQGTSLRLLRFDTDQFTPIEDFSSVDVSGITSHEGLHALKHPGASDTIAFISQGAVYAIRDPFGAFSTLEQLIGPTGSVLVESIPAVALLAHDLDGDGFGDLVAVLDEGPGAGDEYIVPVMFNGNGPLPLGVEPEPQGLADLGAVQQIAMGDVDGDGNDDLIFRTDNNGTARIAWTLRDGARVWSRDLDVLGGGGSVDFPLGTVLTDLAVADLSRQDKAVSMLAVSREEAWVVREGVPVPSLLRDQCRGEGVCNGWGVLTRIAVDPEGGRVALGADLNITPIIAENTRACSPRLEMPRAFVLPEGPGQGSAAIADVNFDGRPDLVHALEASGTELRVWRGRGDGSFKPGSFDGEAMIAQFGQSGAPRLHTGVMNPTGFPHSLIIAYSGEVATAFELDQGFSVTETHTNLEPCDLTFNPNLEVTDIATIHLYGDPNPEIIAGCRDDTLEADSWTVKVQRYQPGNGFVFNDFVLDELTIPSFRNFSCPGDRCYVAALGFADQGSYVGEPEPLADAIVLGETITGQTPTGAHLVMAYNNTLSGFTEAAAVSFLALPEGLELADLDSDGADDAIVRLRGTDGTPALHVARFIVDQEAWQTAPIPLTGDFPEVVQVLGVTPVDAGDDGLKSLMILVFTADQGATTLIAQPDGDFSTWTVSEAEDLPAAVNDADALVSADLDSDGSLDVVFSGRNVVRVVPNAKTALDDAPFVPGVGDFKGLGRGTPEFMSVFELASAQGGGLAALAYSDDIGSPLLTSAYDLDLEPSQWLSESAGDSFPNPFDGLMMDVDLDGVLDLVMWSVSNIVVLKLTPDMNPPPSALLPLTSQAFEPFQSPVNPSIAAAHTVRLLSPEVESLAVLSDPAPGTVPIVLELFETNATPVGGRSLSSSGTFDLGVTAGPLEDSTTTDVDNDGLTDLVLAAGRHGIYVSYGSDYTTRNAMVALPSNTTLDRVIRNVAAADMDQDGRPELAVIGTDVSSVARLEVWGHDGFEGWFMFEFIDPFTALELPLYEEGSSALDVTYAPELGGALITVTYPSRGLVDVFLASGMFGSFNVSRWGTFGLPGETLVDAHVLDRDGDGWQELLTLVGRPDVGVVLRAAPGAQ